MPITLSEFLEATHGLHVPVDRLGRDSIGGGAHSDIWKGSIRSHEGKLVVAVKSVRWFENADYNSDRASKIYKVTKYPISNDWKLIVLVDAYV